MCKAGFAGDDAPRAVSISISLCFSSYHPLSPLSLHCLIATRSISSIRPFTIPTSTTISFDQN